MCDDATNDDASFRQVQEHTFSPENQSFAVQPFLAQAHSWFTPIAMPYMSTGFCGS